MGTDTVTAAGVVEMLGQVMLGNGIWSGELGRRVWITFENNGDGTAAVLVEEEDRDPVCVFRLAVTLESGNAGDLRE